jgi:hypothetical protein
MLARFNLEKTKIMKSKLILIISLVTLAVALSYTFTTSNEELINLEEGEELPDFTEIENSSVFDLNVKQGKIYALTVEAPADVKRYIKTKIKNGRLIISSRKGSGFKFGSSVVISVTTNTLTYIENSGTGDLLVSPHFKVNTLKIINRGTGNANLSLDFRTLKIKNTGTGDVKLEGEGHELDISNNGTGDIDAIQMPSDLVVVSNNGTGDIHVFAEKELTISTQGMGDVSYKGNAKVKKLKNRGYGEVKKID